MRKAMTYDAAEFLETDEDIVAYLNAALDDGDPALVSAALGDIARARGMTQCDPVRWLASEGHNSVCLERWT